MDEQAVWPSPPLLYMIFRDAATCLVGGWTNGRGVLWPPRAEPGARLATALFLEERGRCGQTNTGAHGGRGLTLGAPRGCGIDSGFHLEVSLSLTALTPTWRSPSTRPRSLPGSVLPRPAAWASPTLPALASHPVPLVPSVKLRPRVVGAEDTEVKPVDTEQICTNRS